jgi:hypothetical protein
LAKNTAGRQRFPAPSSPQFDAAPCAICSLRASVFCPEDSLPASPLVRAVDQPGGAAEVVADVQPLAREPAPAGAVVVVPAVAAAAQASLLSVHVVRLEPAVEGVVSLAAATVQA